MTESAGGGCSRAIETALDRGLVPAPSCYLDAGGRIAVNLTAILSFGQPVVAVVLLVGGIVAAAIGMTSGWPVWHVVLVFAGVVAAAVGIALVTSCGEGSR